MRRSNSGLSAFFLVILGVGLFAGLLWFNARNSSPIVPLLPTQAQPTDEGVSIAQILDTNFGSGATLVPTLELPQLQATRPIVAQPSGPSPSPISASDASNQAVATSLPIAVTPTPAPATANASLARGTSNPEEWSIPALIPPLSLDPEGRDHYWFRRPIESNANNTPLDYYSFGANGFFGSTIHHGIDMPNDIGQIIYAAASGTVIFAADVLPADQPMDVFENSSSYGNAVFIHHDFGYNGQHLYTLYAHMQRALVTEGDYVQAGDPIGLVGETGRVSGPHVHFEVRMGGDGTIHPRYADTYNPILWMVPYRGTGIVAGRVIDASGNPINDATITIRNRTGITRTTSSYVFQGIVDDVKPDIRWQENFAIGDIPVGRYDVIVRINDVPIVQQIDVREGMTNFIVLRPPDFQAEGTAETNDG
jgi:murein DD-endopeptidase MepM/ murein hydrolase activator NlpD